MGLPPLDPLWESAGLPAPDLSEAPQAGYLIDVLPEVQAGHRGAAAAGRGDGQIEYRVGGRVVADQVIPGQVTAAISDAERSVGEALRADEGRVVRAADLAAYERDLGRSAAATTAAGAVSETISAPSERP